MSTTPNNKIWVKLPTDFHPQHRVNGMVSVDPVEGWTEYVDVGLLREAIHLIQSIERRCGSASHASGWTDAQESAEWARAFLKKMGVK